MPRPSAGSRRLIAACLATCWLLGAGVIPSEAGKIVVGGGAAGAPGGHVAVIGSVARPGAYELPSANVNLTDIVQVAGGLSPEASGNVRVIRNGRGGFQTFYSNQTRYPLWAGDVVIIDQRSHVIPRKGASPLISVALVNLVGRPVVVDLPAEYASLRGLLHLLRNPLTPQATLAVMSPGRSLQSLTLPLAPAPLALSSGTVIIFDPTTVVVRNLPPLPPAIRPQDVLAAQAAGVPPQNGVSHGSAGTDLPTGYSQADTAGSTNYQDGQPVRRNRVQTWNAHAGEGMQRMPKSPSNAHPLTSASEPSGSTSPLLSIPNPAVQPSANLPNPMEPFSSSTALTPVNHDPALLVTASTANVPSGDLPSGETSSQPSDPTSPLPSTSAELLPTDEPVTAPVKKTTKHSNSGNVVLSILACLALTAGFGMWLKHRAAMKIAALSQTATTSPAGNSPAADGPATPAASPQQKVPQSELRETAAAARPPSGPVQYDVVMPPNSPAAPTTNVRPTSGTSLRVDAASQPGLLDRVLASVHANRKL